MIENDVVYSDSGSNYGETGELLCQYINFPLLPWLSFLMVRGLSALFLSQAIYSRTNTEVQTASTADYSSGRSLHPALGT